MRIALVSDTHGSVPALEAALAACRAAAPDVIVHAGDLISTPFSPDPPGETIAILRAERVAVVYGNGEVYLRDWNTARWDATLAQRRRRPDPPDYFLSLIPAGVAELTADDLAWLRQLPEELVLDGARPRDVYVCHGMPGNTFATPWDTNPELTPAFTPGEVAEALSRPGIAAADLILCGHTHYPLIQRTELPNGRTALVVRNCGTAHGPGGTYFAGYALLTHRGPTTTGYLEWEITVGSVPYQPRHPEWVWSQPSYIWPPGTAHG
jgi:predicted phosphodiesterase